MNRTLILSLLAFASFGLISGHFTLEYPPTRGFLEDDEDKFCGGFSTNATGRHPFPLTGEAHVAITAHHGTPKVSLSMSFKPNFKDQAEFNGTEILSNYQLGHTGMGCFPIDLANITSHLEPKPKNGSLATLQVKYEAGGETLYQCSDLVLVQDPSVSNQSISSCSADQSHGSTNMANPNTAQQNAQTSSSERSYYLPLSLSVYIGFIISGFLMFQ